MPSHNGPHDFVGTLQDLVNTDVSVVPLKLVLAQVAIPTVYLNGVVNDISAGIRRISFGRSHYYAFLRLVIIDRFSCSPYHQPRARQSSRHISQLEFNRLELGELPIELLAMFDVSKALGQANSSCTQT